MSGTGTGSASFPWADGHTPIPAVEGADAEWLVLTEGMEPYERFRYIARHVLSAAIDASGAYAVDARIFEACEDDASNEDHLRALERALAEDGSLTEFERGFLCAAIAGVLRERGAEAACPWDGFVRLAGGPVRPGDE